MTSPNAKPVSAYRNAEDSRRDAREAQGYLTGRVAAAAVWAFFAGIVLLFLFCFVLWGLVLSAAW
jgi:hypothetical protein